jgi:hypothetical protein
MSKDGPSHESVHKFYGFNERSPLRTTVIGLDFPKVRTGGSVVHRRSRRNTTAAGIRNSGQASPRLKRGGALRTTDDNHVEAAAILDIHVTCLYRLIRNLYPKG